MQEIWAQIYEKQVLKDNYRTYDIMSEGKTLIGTSKMGDLIANKMSYNRI